MSRPVAILALCCCVAAADEPTGTNWNDNAFLEGAPWKEEALTLPPYPDTDRLLEVPVSLSGGDYRVLVDPDSLSVGGDRVVRYTRVITSSSGVPNISYEGLHCGERQYRRYAYGSNGAWHPIAASRCERLSDTGFNHIRHALYWNYFCDPVRTNRDVEALLGRLRHPTRSFLTDSP
jgi:hypothetical protein